jgi:hypothetical protein
MTDDFQNVEKGKRAAELASANEEFAFQQTALRQSELFGEEFFDEHIRPHAERCLAGGDVDYQDWFDFPSAKARFMQIHYYSYRNADGVVLGFIVKGT